MLRIARIALPDGKWIVFRSNLRGPIQVYAVEVVRAATPPVPK
jgi:hypothetical protein